MIEDNPDTRKFLEVMLGREFTIMVAPDGYNGIELAKLEKPDLILLDVVMPTQSGYDTCKALRNEPLTHRIPIIFLSAKNSSAEIAYGLSMGADDYIPKPFDHKELMVRIKTRLQRSESPYQVLRSGALEIQVQDRVVKFADREIDLTLTEFDILRLLVSRKGVTISRQEIMKEIWRTQNDTSKDRTIDVHIRSIRKKIPETNDLIKSIYGVGYQFDDEASK